MPPHRFARLRVPPCASSRGASTVRARSRVSVGSPCGFAHGRRDRQCVRSTSALRTLISSTPCVRRFPASSRPLRVVLACAASAGAPPFRADAGGRTPKGSGPLDASETGGSRVSRRAHRFGDPSASRGALSATVTARESSRLWCSCRLLRRASRARFSRTAIHREGRQDRLPTLPRERQRASSTRSTFHRQERRDLPPPPSNASAHVNEDRSNPTHRLPFLTDGRTHACARCARRDSAPVHAHPARASGFRPDARRWHASLSPKTAWRLLQLRTTHGHVSQAAGPRFAHGVTLLSVIDRPSAYPLAGRRAERRAARGASFRRRLARTGPLRA